MTDLNPFTRLVDALEREGKLTWAVDRPINPKGDWWLNLTIENFRTSLLWREHFGFGVFSGDALYGERPNEIFTDAEKAARRLLQLASKQALSQGEAALTLKDVRQLTGSSQATMAQALNTGQAEISRLETRDDVHLSRLKDYIQALGGELELSVRFPDFQGPLRFGAQTSAKPDPATEFQVLKAADPAALADFYRGLGFELREEKHGKGPIHFSFMCHGALTEIYPDSAKLRVPFVTKLSYAVPDINAVCKKAAWAGGEILKMPTRSSRGHLCILRDPEGHEVELTQEKPRRSTVSSGRKVVTDFNRMTKA